MAFTLSNPVTVGGATKKTHYDASFVNTIDLLDYLLGAQDLGANWLISTGRQLRLSDPDVAHGMTDLFPTDVYGVVYARDGLIGGLQIEGYSDADSEALFLVGTLGTATPTKAAIHLFGGKKSGTTRQALATGELLLEVSNAGTSRLRLYGDGSVVLGGGTGYPLASPSYLNILRTNTEEVQGLALMNEQLGGWGSGIRIWSRQNFGSNLMKEAARIQILGMAGWSSDATSDSRISLQVLTDAVLTERVNITGSGVEIPDGLVVGFSGTPVAGQVRVGDASFALQWISSTEVRVVGDTGEYWKYDRTQNRWSTVIGGLTSIQIFASDLMVGGGSLATSATAGFVHIPTMAGAPTGTPAPPTGGFVATVYDTTNNKLYVYNGAWKSVTLA